MSNSFRRRLFLVVLAVVSIWAFLFYTHTLVRKLESENRENCETIAWLWAGVQYPLGIVGDTTGLMSCTECGFPIARTDFSSEKLLRWCPGCGDTTLFIHTQRMLPEERRDVIDFTRKLFADLVMRLGFPTIFADNAGNPQIVDGEVVDSFPGDRIAELRKRMALLEEENVPVPIYARGDTIGHLYYGTPKLASEMKLMPFLELGLLLFVAAVLFVFFRTESSREREMSWVGFARETAHQISTPLSSLMGWIELLKEDPELSASDEFNNALKHMEADVARLNSIAMRYGQMGRAPKLKPVSVEKTVAEVVGYFNARKGLLGSGVELEFHSDGTEHTVMGNAVLLGWVLENLVKNAVASCAGSSDGGKITINCIPSEGGSDIDIRVSDNGRGIPYAVQGKIFRAGFTTRKGGWGLGLSLARRIVEEYHHGTIRLLSSTPGVGTVFSLILPLKGGADSDNDTVG